MRDPKCPACDLLFDGSDCGGHWQTIPHVHNVVTGKRGRVSLDVYEGEDANADGSWEGGESL
jgi:hypothetical protein